MTGITTDQRVEIWGNTHPVGFTITKLHQSILDGTAQNFLFFKYEFFLRSLEIFHLLSHASSRSEFLTCCSILNPIDFCFIWS